MGATNQIELSPNRIKGPFKILASEEQMPAMILTDEDRNVCEAYPMVVDILFNVEGRELQNYGRCWDDQIKVVCRSSNHTARACTCYSLQSRLDTSFQR